MRHYEVRQHVAEDTNSMEYSLLKSFLAGSLSGTCSTLLFQPLDLIKTRLQNSTKKGTIKYGMFTHFVQVLKNERLLGLWQGTVPSMMRCVPGVGMYFSSLHWLQMNLGSPDPSALECVTFGVLARTFCGFTLLPMTVLKTRFESGVYKYGSLLDALKKIYRTEGPRGLYTGLVPTLVRDAPFSGIYLMFYTQAKKMVPLSLQMEVSPAPLNFCCGMVAGILAAGITQPADVIKTRMQLYPTQYKSVIGTISIVLKENGIPGFFSGMLPRVIRRTLISAMGWTVYEQVLLSINLKD